MQNAKLQGPRPRNKVALQVSPLALALLPLPHLSDEKNSKVVFKDKDQGSKGQHPLFGRHRLQSPSQTYHWTLVTTHPSLTGVSPTTYVYT